VAVRATELAGSLGLSVEVTRLVSIVVAALLAASSVSVAGLLPVGIILSLLGAPFFLYLLRGGLAGGKPGR